MYMNININHSHLRKSKSTRMYDIYIQDIYIPQKCYFIKICNEIISPIPNYNLW